MGYLQEDPMPIDYEIEEMANETSLVVHEDEVAVLPELNIV